MPKATSIPATAARRRCSAHDGAALVQRNLAELFAPESRPAVLDYLAGIKGAGVASLLDHGRDVLGQVREGGFIPLSMTMGRTRADGPNFFAVFRDLSQTRKSEGELQQARRLTDRAANAKADMLARISHEVRTPLNAIIGFAEVMIGERFGALGNERYVEYMKDIRASGERVIAIINDLLDLSRIETGKLDLSFASQNLNDLVEQCVAVMQPQANRERIIIRTSLAHLLPPVLADSARIAPDHAQPDRQLDPSRQCRRPGHRLHRAVRFRRGDLEGPRYRAWTERQRSRGRHGAVPKPGAVGSGLRGIRRQPFADQGAGRGQPRPLPDQDRDAFRHADRSGVSGHHGAGLKAAFSSAARQIMRDRVPSESIDTQNFVGSCSQAARARMIAPDTTRPTPATRLRRWPSGSNFSHAT